MRVLDPIVTTATVTRAFGTMVQDTLVTLDQAPRMFLGQFTPPAACRADLNGVLRTGVHTF